MHCNGSAISFQESMHFFLNIKGEEMRVEMFLSDEGRSLPQCCRVAGVRLPHRSLRSRGQGTCTCNTESGKHKERAQSVSSRTYQIPVTEKRKYFTVLIGFQCSHFHSARGAFRIKCTGLNILKPYILKRLRENTTLKPCS